MVGGDGGGGSVQERTTRQEKEMWGGWVVQNDGWGGRVRAERLFGVRVLGCK